MSATVTQSFIQTYTRKRFNPFQPQPADICVRDIAHSLSLICRFNGHVVWHYSIAQHSLMVADLLPPELRLWGVLHDTAECIGGDMVRPLKHTPEMWMFRRVEHGIQAAVYSWFGLNIADEPIDLLKRADKMAVKAEMYALLRGGPLPEMAAYVEDVPMPVVTFQPMLPSDVERQFSSVLAQEFYSFQGKVLDMPLIAW